jgi:hypothetical protein
MTHHSSDRNAEYGNVPESYKIRPSTSPVPQSRVMYVVALLLASTFALCGLATPLVQGPSSWTSQRLKVYYAHLLFQRTAPLSRTKLFPFTIATELTMEPARLRGMMLYIQLPSNGQTPASSSTGWSVKLSSVSQHLFVVTVILEGSMEKIWYVIWYICSLFPIILNKFSLLRPGAA